MITNRKLFNEIPQKVWPMEQVTNKVNTMKTNDVQIIIGHC